MNEPETGNAERDGTSDRRAERRLKLRLKVECWREGCCSEPVIRAITRDICSRGLFLEMATPAFGPHDRLRVDLTLPPAEGVSPYEGRASCDAEVLRAVPLPSGKGDAPALPRGHGIAARFLEPLRLSY